MKKLIGLTVLLTVLSLYGGSDTSMPAPVDMWKGGNKFLALCYHDIPNFVNEDKYAVDLASFVGQIEFLRSRGCRFIGIKDIMEARDGRKKLPHKAVLLTFDDAYDTFYKNVYPMLKLYGYPCVLAIVAKWIEIPPHDDSTKALLSVKPDDTPPNSPYPDKKFMNWKQIREVAQSGLVNVASHTYDSHQAVLMNPEGSTSAAVYTRIYNPETKSYETAEEYRNRIYADFKKSYDVIKEKTGIAPDVMVWPYGKYNKVSVELAEKAGFKVMLTLDDGWGDVSDIKAIPRYMLSENPFIGEFAKLYKRNFKDPVRLRIVQADLDLIYDKNPEQMNKNIDKFVERIFKIKPTTVYLQAFADPDGNGNIASVYFPNSILPMRADLFSRVARSLIIREIQVYAWMPMLSIVLPDRKKTESLRVVEFKKGVKRPATSWYERLSPFSEETVRILQQLYGDLAKSSDISGIIFQDDGYLNDFEDFHPDALKEYVRISGSPDIPFSKLSEEKQNEWTDLKTDKLNELTEKLMKAVEAYRPEILFARTIYASVVTEPDSEEWFAQNYEKCLKIYDYTVIMSYPKMEKVSSPCKWLRKVVEKASLYPDALDKTVFKVQTYDWDSEEWISSETVVEWLRTLVAAGARNIAYYPDDYTVNEPELKVIREMISAEDFPFPPQ